MESGGIGLDTVMGMSEENVEVVHRFLDPYEGRDVMPVIRAVVAEFGPDPDRDHVLAWWADDPAWRYLLSEVEWDTTAIPGIGTKVKGPTEVANWWADWTDAWESYMYRTTEIRDLGGSVLTRAAVEARAPGGVPIEMTVVQLWTVLDGKVATCRVFTSESEALEAAGLSE
jgi:ketosteroid isomerase-like protein